MKMITAEEIEKIGTTLFGPKWPAPMARAFSVHLNTTYNWKARGAGVSTFTGALARHLITQRVALAAAERLISEHNPDVLNTI